MFRCIVYVFLWVIAASLTIDAEIRGVWLTTNMGLDWPGKSFDEESQKRKMLEMLDKLSKAHFNLVLFQVQANGDVAWNSRYQPPMNSITGDGSRPLSYDVCRFVIDECHKRGMKCHAWIVPFRVGGSRNISAYSSNTVSHVVKEHPKWCIPYSGTYYIDPANPDARKYLYGLYQEMLEKYDFDGINLDYTRYPGDKFPDAASYRQYNPEKLDRDDWRRANINTFVAGLYEVAKNVRPGITVGSAPIGTYKNVGGFRNATAYGSFQQDPVQWVRSGHHDLVIPQMYWGEKNGFSTHLSTWLDECQGSQVVIGLAPYRMIDSDWNFDTVKELVEKARAKDGVAGVCFFRTEHVIGNNPDVRKLYQFLVDTPLAEEPLTIPVVEKFME